MGDFLIGCLKQSRKSPNCVVLNPGYCGSHFILQTIQLNQFYSRKRFQQLAVQNASVFFGKRIEEIYISSNTLIPFQGLILYREIVVYLDCYRPMMKLFLICGLLL